MSEKQYRDKIVAIKKQQATDETNRGKARAAAGKHRADAAKELQKITPRTSATMARPTSATRGTERRGLRPRTRRRPPWRSSSASQQETRQRLRRTCSS